MPNFELRFMKSCKYRETETDEVENNGLAEDEETETADIFND